MVKLYSLFVIVSLFIFGCTSKTTTEPGAPFRGVLTGRVFDAYSNGPVSGAIVSFFNGQNSAVTDDTGYFEIDSIPIGMDKITILKSGYLAFADSVIIITDHLSTYTAFIRPVLKGWITGWQHINSPTAENLTNASWANANTIYACGFAGAIVRSTDNGVSWKSVNSPTPENLYCIHFSDANTGVIMGNSGTIFHTNDGGATWTSVSGGNIRDFRNVSFSDALHGFAVGGNGTGSGPAIMKTTDGGKSWTDLVAGFSGSGLSSNGMYGVAAINSSLAFAGSADGQIFKTSDGGASWAKNLGSAGWVRSFAFANASSGEYAANGGILRYTTNGGSSWIDYSLGTGNDLQSVGEPDLRHSIAVGSSGTIFYTRTGGASWLDQSLPGSPNLLGVAFADSIHAVIVGEGGTILIPTIE